MKVLGLDLGTNSIGWGIVDEWNHKIENCGVYIFPEGVKKQKKELNLLKQQKELLIMPLILIQRFVLLLLDFLMIRLKRQ